MLLTGLTARWAVVSISPFVESSDLPALASRPRRAEDASAREAPWVQTAASTDGRVGGWRAEPRIGPTRRADGGSFAYGSAAARTRTRSQDVKLPIMSVLVEHGHIRGSRVLFRFGGSPCVFSAGMEESHVRASTEPGPAARALLTHVKVGRSVHGTSRVQGPRGRQNPLAGLLARGTDRFAVNPLVHDR